MCVCSQPRGQLEFLVDGVSQGKISLEAALPPDVMGCVAVCGGGEITTGSVPMPPLPPPAPGKSASNPHWDSGPSESLMGSKCLRLQLRSLPELGRRS